MKPAAVLLGLLAATQEASAIVDKWTPEGFDWDALTPIHGVATQNVTTGPPTKELSLYAASLNVTDTDLITHQAFPIAISIGVALRAVSFLSEAASITSTVLGCWDLIGSAVGGKQVSEKAKNSCAWGVAGSVLGFGLSGARRYLNGRNTAAALVQGPPPRVPTPDLGPDFVQSMELTDFSSIVKRGETHPWKRSLEGRGISRDDHFGQFYHNQFTQNMIRDANLGEGTFLGYAHDDHQLSRRDGLHPLAPRFQFDHPKHGPMVLSTMSTNSTFHISVEPWLEDNPKVSKRWNEQYRKEALGDKRWVEGRFDHSAAEADPATVNVDAARAFQTAEDSLHCYFGPFPWPLDEVIDMQAYDFTNKATFGYASVGIFNQNNHEAQLGGLEPQPPVTGGDKKNGANC